MKKNMRQLLWMTLLSGVAFVARAQDVALSPCEALYGKPVTAGSQVRGKFIWSRPNEEISAKAWYPVIDPTADFIDERRAIIGLESDKECFALLEGADLPKSTSFEVSGDLKLEKFEINPGKDLLLVKSRTFNSSVTEYGALFAHVDGVPKKAFKLLWSNLSYESSPAGDEIFYPIKLSPNRAWTIEYASKGLSKKSETYRLDPRSMTMSRQ